MKIEQIVFLSNACYVFSKNKDISSKHNGRFRFQASTFTSVRRQTLPRLNFGETRYGVFQIFICTSVQYLIYCITYWATRWILHIWKCFNPNLFWFFSTKDILASTCTCFVYHHLTAITWTNEIPRRTWSLSPFVPHRHQRYFCQRQIIRNIWRPIIVAVGNVWSFGTIKAKI